MGREESGGCQEEPEDDCSTEKDAMEKGCHDVAYFWMKEKVMGDLAMACKSLILETRIQQQGFHCLAITNIERDNGRRQGKKILEIRNEAKIQVRKITRRSGGFSENWKYF